MKFNIKNKKLYEYTQEELNKKALYHKIFFYLYATAAAGIAILGGYVGLETIDIVMNVSDSLSITLILLFGFFGVLNFFLIMFLLFTNESGYYRTQQLLVETIIYIKEKTE